jgi:hypothetical protein
MFKHLHYVAYALLLPAVIAAAEDRRNDSEPKVISGMSIVGNDETPKSLYIVPWKDSKVGKEVNFTAGILNEELNRVDKSDFIRELNFYKQSNPN